MKFFHVEDKIRTRKCTIIFSVILDVRSPKKHVELYLFFSFYSVFRFMKADLPSGVYNVRIYICINNIYTFVELL